MLNIQFTYMQIYRLYVFVWCGIVHKSFASFNWLENIIKHTYFEFRYAIENRTHSRSIFSRQIECFQIKLTKLIYNWENSLQENVI